MLFLLVDFKIFAQDSLKTYPKIRPVLRYDNRNYINKSLHNPFIWGFMGGVVFGKKEHEFDIGYYGQTANPDLKFFNFTKNSIIPKLNPSYFKEADFHYWSLQHWHTVIDKNKFNISVPLEIGIGSYKTNTVLNGKTIRAKQYFVPIHAGLEVEWRFSRPLGFNFIGGYRYSLLHPTPNFNGFYFGFGPQIHPEFYTMLFKPFRRKRP